MEVGNGLASVCAAVGDNAVAVCDARFFCDSGDLFKNIGYDGGVFAVYFVNASDVRFGNDEDVNGCLGGDIIERKDLFVLIRFFGGNIAVYDLTEKAVFYHIIYTPLNHTSRGALGRSFSIIGNYAETGKNLFRQLTLTPSPKGKAFVPSPLGRVS